MTSPDHASHRPQSPDAEEWAERLLFAHWRSLEPGEKLQLVSDLCRAAERLSLAGMAARHPHADARELDLRLACLRPGRQTVEQVLGHPLGFDLDAS